MSAATESAPAVTVSPGARSRSCQPPRTRAGATVVPLRRRAIGARRRATWRACRLTVAVGRPAGQTGARTRGHAVDGIPDAPPLRLTARGLAVLAAATALVAAALISVARLSAPTGEAATVVTTPISVHSGDTLWSIAASLAPHRDPRLVVADLERVNHLTTSVLTPGQRLRPG
jgi:hypothetical protein